MQISEIYNYALLVAALVGAGAQAKKSHESKEKEGLDLLFFFLCGLNAVHALYYFGSQGFKQAVIVIMLANLIFLTKNIIVCAVRFEVSYITSTIGLISIGAVTLLLGNTLVGIETFYGGSELLSGLGILFQAITVFRQSTAKGISKTTMGIYTPTAFAGIISSLSLDPLLLVARTMVFLSFLYILLFKMFKKE